MFENLSNKVSTISSDTQIIFTVKSFFTLILSILIIFLGFYQLVFVPKISNIEKQFDRQLLQNQQFHRELTNINSSINTLSTSLEVLKLSHANLPQPNTLTNNQHNTILSINKIDSTNIHEMLVNNTISQFY